MVPLIGDHLKYNTKISELIEDIVVGKYIIPNISSQYLASLYCCDLQQWFSNESITGYSDVTNAVSRMAYITSLNKISVHIARPWVIIGSSSSPFPRTKKIWDLFLNCDAHLSKNVAI